MTTMLRAKGTAASPGSTRQLALAVADANWFTTENLFAALDRPDVSTLLLSCLDYVNAWRRSQRPWNWRHELETIRPGLCRHELVLPSGWMKRFPTLGMRPIARAVERWQASHAAGAPLALIMTYPHYLFLRDRLQPDRSVYFNLDDYTLYWPSVAGEIRAIEQRAVREADLTVCVAHRRAEELRQAVPEAAHKIRHLPHGAPSNTIRQGPPETFVNPPEDLTDLPRPWLGYVGSLEDRVEWTLLERLGRSLPHASIVLVGRVPAGEGAWCEERRRCLELPNVHAIGWRPQAEVGRYNQSFDVCLIPYKVDHPFNISCCPTKVMDTMGSGRPIVSTELPECRLYHHLFDVAEDPEQFVEIVRERSAGEGDDRRASARIAWAMENTCARVAERLLDWIKE